MLPQAFYKSSRTRKLNMQINLDILPVLLINNIFKMQTRYTHELTQGRYEEYFEL